ncbi:hypothetical protein QT972_09780 [Microcoleus sp. herbarium7]|uniref:hypothetical protein n=1 Tax=Microcoleus sp. herbarium7 TaxID=3055435 RepID=UPI002FD0F0EC
MNQDTYGTAAKGNNLFDVIKVVAKKIATVFTPKKVKFSYANASEAIEYIEWRTKYDQQRIVNHVYILTALVQSQKLCSALGIKEPTYKSKFFGINNRNNNRVYANYAGYTVNMKPVDRFDLLLRKFTGYENPRVQALMSGEEVVAKKTVNKNLQIIVAVKPLSYEDAILEAMRQLIDGIESRLVVEQIEVRPQLAIEAATSIVTIDVIATEIEEVTPVATPQEVTGEQPTEVVQPVQAKLSKKMTIKQLKAYAKERGISVPGRKTKHRDIFEHIKAQQQA